MTSDHTQPIPHRLTQVDPFSAVKSVLATTGPTARPKDMESCMRPLHWPRAGPCFPVFVTGPESEQVSYSTPESPTDVAGAYGAEACCLMRSIVILNGIAATLDTVRTKARPIQIATPSILVIPIPNTVLGDISELAVGRTRASALRIGRNANTKGQRYVHLL